MPGRSRATGQAARDRLASVVGRERLVSDQVGDWELPRRIWDEPESDPGLGESVDDGGNAVNESAADASGAAGVSGTSNVDEDLASVLRQVSASSEPPEWSDDAGAANRIWRFTREHLGIVLVVLAVAVIFAVVQATRSRPEAVPAPSVVVETPGDGASGAASSSARPAASASPVQIKVHVLGAVATPGVVTLPVGARVQDAIAAAGGLTSQADPAELNLAAVVADGSQIVIGTVSHPQGQVNGGAASGASGGTASGATVNLNTATQAQLEQLPGVGPVTAQKILAWRDQHGKFTSANELQEVDGIGPKTFAQLEPYVTV